MKISILTFSKEINYGANLQCYALFKYLTELGHNVNIIDIQLNRYKYGIIYNLLTIYDRLLFKKFREEHLNAFTSKYNTVDELIANPPKSDLYIVGSDQVWNPDITKRLNPYVYFFSFLPDGTRRIAYAASFGTDKWENIEMIPKIKKLLEKFEAISVREQEGVNICKETFNVNAVEVSDPTLLLTSYKAIYKDKDKVRNNNQLIYFKFIRNKECEKVIIDFCKEKKLNPIYLSYKKPIKGFKFKPYASIKEWLNLIRNAKFIITDSFHCTVFCILFRRQFITLPSIKGRSSRMTNLLTKLGILERYCSNTCNLSTNINILYTKKIDYDEIQLKLENIRKESKTFLNNILNKNNRLN